MGHAFFLGVGGGVGTRKKIYIFYKKDKKLIVF